MSTITVKDVIAALMCLAEWYPQAFTLETNRPNRPLKVGIDRDLEVRCLALERRERGALLRYYTSRITYLRGLVAGAARVGPRRQSSR